ncbi:hypothetical protein [Amantichitinum ursilacus]|uniref:Uncharacterized protein n=1 Tax=Amantichitinum ursilacus TaxID=857265 RepID=A0A0N0GM12_9NEIS|nr:hypothetical protein [Amantichitinum ursilacus]KPC50664.1 hypothetical protein WG78_16460 [Amantichitinum ursilacus]
MQVYVEFLGHLPQFQYDADRLVAIHLLHGAEVSCSRGHPQFGHHSVCVKWPGAPEAECHVDGGKFALLQILAASQLGGGGAAATAWSAELMLMLQTSMQTETDDAAARGNR